LQRKGGSPLDPPEVGGAKVASSVGLPDPPRKREGGGRPPDLHEGEAAVAGSAVGVDDDEHGRRHGGGGAGFAVGEGAGAAAAWIHVPSTHASPPCTMLVPPRPHEG